jgi:hypothetical protein
MIKSETQKALITNSFLNEGKINFSLSKEEESYRTVYENLAYGLAILYGNADWKSIARSRNVYALDVFQHKTKVAARKMNIRRVFDKICLLLGLQSIPFSSTIIDHLEDHQLKTLDILRKESIYITRKAYELHKRLIEYNINRKEKDQDNTKLDSFN